MKINVNNILVLGFALCIVLTGCDTDDIVVPLDEIIPGFPQLVDVPFTIGADEYINNRFFMLDLPALEPNGRSSDEMIDPHSVQVFQSLEPGLLDDNGINFVAVYIDSTGFRDWDSVDFQNPEHHATRWREIFFSTMNHEDGTFQGIDLGRNFEVDDSYLAVIYNVVLSDGTVVSQVGDRPGWDAPSLIIDHDHPDDLYYRMKLLKTPFQANHPHVFQYVRRNIYSLSTVPFDNGPFDLQIEAVQVTPSSEMANESVPWIRLFGLDRGDFGGPGSPDGIVDGQYIDEQRGLLIFPLDFMHPFNAEPDQYQSFVEPGDFVWEDSYLQQNLMPQIYDPSVDPDSYPLFRNFQITGYVQQYDYSGVLAGEVRLARLDWSWPSAPVQTLDGGRQFQPVSRVENVRWFLPKERVLARYLDPDLTNTAGDETVPSLECFFGAEDDLWELESWGGIMRAVSRTGIDLSGHSHVEIWVNDGQPDREQRSGRLHIEFGFISEDGFWPVSNDTGELIMGRWEREDGILENPHSPDGIWQGIEDVGLNYQSSSGGDPLGLQTFSNEYVSSSNPFPGINGTAGNNREDSEDLNDNAHFDLENAYFSQAIDLKDTQPLVDVVYDYENVDGLIAEGIAWRKYWLSLDNFNAIANSGTADLSRVTHLRIWYENNAAGAPAKNHFQFARLKFVR